LEVARGRFLTKADNDHFENVAILGAEAARLIFPGENEEPVGQTVKIGSDYYTVVGVLKGRTSALAVDPREKDFDSDVFLPLNTCKLRFGDRIVSNRPETGLVAEETQLSRIIVELDPKTPVDAVKSRIQGVINSVHPKGDVEVLSR
jgi:putative ABC transport system permease protein